MENRWQVDYKLSYSLIRGPGWEGQVLNPMMPGLLTWCIVWGSFSCFLKTLHMILLCCIRRLETQNAVFKCDMRDTSFQNSFCCISGLFTLKGAWQSLSWSNQQEKKKIKNLSHSLSSLQMHPLGLCNNNDEEDLYEYGWVGVVKLEQPELDPSCLTVLGKVRNWLFPLSSFYVVPLPVAHTTCRSHFICHWITGNNHIAFKEEEFPVHAACHIINLPTAHTLSLFRCRLAH